eukprot:CAMPEP_0198239700 /NCGR_PEP_ID=MMETSP1446-20131203/5043_1 /TAXON_ID=1461542 ORGANISM="Unidentified sp, Strain CCMP2111" /NCGR_SAMPLE_ID=MMETSP1446 /ASSEMBLY_ACC=CAM_ASM_001112 /LENGTH=552 /DNA_ID=CAMNT_0043922335 /DNA_START=92 /DNA_END=1750 /DNA_ORIENTATION=+
MAKAFKTIAQSGREDYYCCARAGHRLKAYGENGITAACATPTQHHSRHHSSKGIHCRGLKSAHGGRMSTTRLSQGMTPRRVRNSAGHVRHCSTSQQQISVDLLVRDEVSNASIWMDQLADAVDILEADCKSALRTALEKSSMEVSQRMEVSVLISGDEEIRDLNATWRGVNRPTDVLSFPNGEVPPGYDATILGDVVISAETAERQARQRGHSLHDEIRVLMVHGLLHLLDYDHERSEEHARVMLEEEERILKKLNWTASEGLIAQSLHGASTASLGKREKPVKLIALDMDGTLLNNDLVISDANREALMECKRRDIHVVLATGKARNAALLACQKSGLGGMFTNSSPGIFIQGLEVYGPGGKVLAKTFLPKDVVKDAFVYAEDHAVPCCAFLGKENRTLSPHFLLDELHERYFEPKSLQAESVEAIASENVHKVLYFAEDKKTIDEVVRPYWESRIGGRAKLTQAIPEMLEIVPMGSSKAIALEKVLAEYGIEAEEVMAMGDGENDVEMLSFAGLGVAVENANPKLKDVADFVVSSNEKNGVAEALWNLVL